MDPSYIMVYHNILPTVNYWMFLVCIPKKNYHVIKTPNCKSIYEIFFNKKYCDEWNTSFTTVVFLIKKIPELLNSIVVQMVL